MNLNLLYGNLNLDLTVMKNILFEQENKLGYHLLD